MGFLLSLSSTAIVLKMLQERGELTAPHGRVSVAILIFQDIVVVLMILLTPILAGQSEDPMNTLLWLVVKVAGTVVAVLLLAKYIVPTLFRLVVRTKSRELFILTVVVLCFATAWLTSSVGLSLALGAFFAGLIISESEYSHQATGNILPFREIFISFFFVSVGMLLDFQFFIGNILFILLASSGVVLLKMIVIALSVLILRYPPKTVFLTAFSLFQVGEFAFLLSSKGMEYQLLSNEVYQYFLAISIITMGITPFLIKYAPNFINFIFQNALPKQVKERMKAIAKRRAEATKGEESMHDHLVIIGYGINGQNVAKAARRAGISYVVVELDPQALKLAKEAGEKVVYGDAGNEVILRHVHIQEARVVVIAISAHEATRQIVQLIRTFTDTAYVIVRTRYVREVEQVIKLGADEVIPEEFETSIEIFTRVLKKYLVPIDEIQGFVNDIRSHNYEMLRGMAGASGQFTPIHIPDMEIATVTVRQGHNRIVGKTLQDSDLRNEFGITVLAIKRKNKFVKLITPEEVVLEDDILYIFGRPDDIIRVNKHFLFRE
jgi:CPA2 family monovalent cation:H+ antiporter-2